MKKADILLFIFLASVFSTCKKYPDGPCISLRSKRDRIRGEWEVQKYLIDGGDSTAAKYPIPCKYRITDKEHSLKFYSPCDTIEGRWEFTENKTHIAIHLDKFMPLYLTWNMEWKIMKLTFKEMHLQTNFSSKEYNVYLIKTEIIK
ncbi:MAG: hypothetical protein EPN85_02840 [Bacteroidetes bacterium]|nr:MAG: hypothetical protein EPN85_02840 [Bacteroidota bacterium]